MPKNTGIKSHEDYLKRVIKEDAKIAGNDEAYRHYLNALTTLVQNTNKVYENDGEFTKETYEDLLKAYQDATEKANNYRVNGKTEIRRDVVNHIQKIISKDFKALNSLDKEKLGTIDTAFENARTIKVNVPADMTHRVGGQISDRFPMVSSDGTKGFFTARTDTAQDKKWNAMLKQIRKMDLPEGVIQRFNQLATDQEMRAGLLRAIHGPDQEKYVYTSVAINLGFFPNTYSAEKLLFNPDNHRLLEAVKIVANEGAKLTAPYDLKDRLGYDPYRRNDNKNAAMYEVAKFLGCDKLVAKAVPMTVVNGKEVMKGTFMEFAEGSDLANLKGDDPLWKFNPETSAYNKDLYRDLADLQVLDYICGNVDRHKGNMCYKTQTEKGKVKLTGLVAIDNDACFPEHKLRDAEFVSAEFGGCFEEPRIFRPKNFRYINKKTAEIIKNMNRGTLETILRGNNISPKAIDEAWKRTQEVQEVLKDMEINNIQYTEEIKEDLSNADMEVENPFRESAEDKHDPSIFSGFNRQLREEVLEEKYFAAVDQAKRKGIKLKKNEIPKLDMKEYAEFKKSEDRKFKVAEGKKVDPAQAIFADSTKIEMMNTMLKRVNDLKSASKEFAKMRAAMSDLAKVSKEYSEIAVSKQTLSDVQIKKYGDCLEALSEATKDYIMKKGLQPRTEKGRDRLDAAKKIDHRVDELLNNFEALKTKEETKLENPEADQDFDM